MWSEKKAGAARDVLPGALTSNLSLDVSPKAATVSLESQSPSDPNPSPARVSDQNYSVFDSEGTLLQDLNRPISPQC